MKILIITTYYPPDTAIAAVRPYMFAKYLNKFGHEVTVLRSGLLRQSADRLFSGHDDIRVISYLGEQTASEQFERGEEDFLQYSSAQGESRISFLAEKIREPLAKIYHSIIAPYDFYRWLKIDHIRDRYDYLAKAIDELAEEHFDVVFSTYGDIENIFGGEYATKVFGAKWILDFRDPIEPHAPNFFGLPFLKWIQKKAVQKANVCTAVSDDLAAHISRQVNGKRVHTIYNGYEPNETAEIKMTSESGQLVICYTGTIYREKQSVTPLLKVLRKLNDDGKIALDNVRIHYAGGDFDYLNQKAAEHQLSNILVNHGYVDRSRTEEIQKTSDLFLVLSWNTRKAKGILTGKFYEGIRANKPILSLVTGDVQNSELYRINEKYHYGFCYEQAREAQQFAQLCDYIEAKYQEKLAGSEYGYTHNPQLRLDFRYDTLSQKLERICQEILSK